MPTGVAKAASASMPSSCSAAYLPWAPGERLSSAVSAACGANEVCSDKAWEGASAILFATRGCFVRVEFGDHPGVPLRNHPALQLHGRRQLTRILRPFLRHQAKSFDGLEIGQACVDFPNQVFVER